MSPGHEGALPAGPCSVAFFGVKGTRRLAVNGQDRRCFPHAGAGPGKGAAPSVAFHCCVMWGLRRRALHEGRQASPFAHSARVPLRSASVSFSLPAGKSFPRRFSPFFPLSPGRGAWCARPAAWAGALRPLLSVPVMGAGLRFFRLRHAVAPEKCRFRPQYPLPPFFRRFFGGSPCRVPAALSTAASPHRFPAVFSASSLFSGVKGDNLSLTRSSVSCRSIFRRAGDTPIRRSF